VAPHIARRLSHWHALARARSRHERASRRGAADPEANSSRSAGSASAWRLWWSVDLEYTQVELACRVLSQFALSCPQAKLGGIASRH
jgi:hypothetical protein